MPQSRRHIFIVGMPSDIATRGRLEEHIPTDAPADIMQFLGDFENALPRSIRARRNVREYERRARERGRAVGGSVVTLTFKEPCGGRGMGEGGNG